MKAHLSMSAQLRWQFVRRALERHTPTKVLEVGCGRGAVAGLVARSLPYRGYEPDSASFRAARETLRFSGRGEVVNSTLPSEPDEYFDCLLALEVLEHIRDDAEALSRWLRWLTPGAVVVVSVPAHPERFGPADERVGHYRRYTRESLVALLEGAGLEVELISTWGFPLGNLLERIRTLIAGLTDLNRPIEDRIADSGRWLQPTRWFGPLVGLLVFPFAWVQLPFSTTELGIGYVGVARMPQGGRI